MGLREQIQTSVVHAFRLARRRSRDLAAREGGMVAGLLSAKPPSIREQDEYAKSRNWVPPGHDGGTLEGMGVIYHALAGRPGVAIHDALSAMWSRPFRFCVTAGIAFTLGLIVLIALGQVMIAALACTALALAVGAWAAAGHLLMRLADANHPARDDEAGES